MHKNNTIQKILSEYQHYSFAIIFQTKNYYRCPCKIGIRKKENCVMCWKGLKYDIFILLNMMRILYSFSFNKRKMKNIMSDEEQILLFIKVTIVNCSLVVEYASTIK